MSDPDTVHFDPVTGQTYTEHCPTTTTTENRHCPVEEWTTVGVSDCPICNQHVPESYVYSDVVPPPCQGCVTGCPECVVYTLPPRPAIPVNTWQDVLVNFRRGNFGALMQMLKHSGPILREQVIPLLKILRENYRYKTRVAKYPVTHWV